jgi:hypothetical protein
MGVGVAREEVLHDDILFHPQDSAIGRSIDL